MTRVNEHLGEKERGIGSLSLLSHHPPPQKKIPFPPAYPDVLFLCIARCILAASKR